MATLDAVFHPGDDEGGKLDNLAAVTSSAEIVIGNHVIFVVSGTGAFHIRFGNSGMGAAAATSFYVPSGAMPMFDLGKAWDRIRIFNPDAAATIDVHYLILARS